MSRKRFYLLYAGLGLSALVVMIGVWRSGAIDESGTVLDLAVSSDGTKAAFALFRSDGEIVRTIRDNVLPGSSWVEARLCTLDLSTLELTRTPHEAIYRMSWSPDSSELVFVSGRARTDFWNLKLLNVRTGEATRIDNGVCFKPRFSPNGEMVAYVRTDELSWKGLSSKRLVVSRRDGEERRIIAKEPDSWCWSLDGSRIFFVDSSYKQILQYDVHSGESNVLYKLVDSPDPLVGLSNLVVSPSGSRLGFITEDSFEAIDLETGTVERIFSCEGTQTAEWGPSGVCYTCEMTVGGFGLLLHAGGKSRELAVGDFREPRWLDSAHVIVVEVPNKIWVYDVHSGERKLVYPKGN